MSIMHELCGIYRAATNGVDVRDLNLELQDRIDLAFVVLERAQNVRLNRGDVDTRPSPIRRDSSTTDIGKGGSTGDVGKGGTTDVGKGHFDLDGGKGSLDVGKGNFEGKGDLDGGKGNRDGDKGNHNKGGVAEGAHTGGDAWANYQTRFERRAVASRSPTDMEGGGTGGSTTPSHVYWWWCAEYSCWMWSENGVSWYI